LDPNDLIKLLDEKKLGKPYKWAQRLCGIKFNETLVDGPSFELCQNTVPELIKQIRSRLQARMKLYYQIQSLEVGKISLVGAVKISSILQQFVALSFAEYSSVGYTRKFIDEGLVNSNDLFYRAILTRGSAKLESYIAVPSDFPNEFPLFAISLDWNDQKLNSENNSNVRVSFIIY
jgi:THO complex subunit 5